MGSAYRYIVVNIDKNYVWHTNYYSLALLVMWFAYGRTSIIDVLNKRTKTRGLF